MTVPLRVALRLLPGVVAAVAAIGTAGIAGADPELPQPDPEVVAADQPAPVVAPDQQAPADAAPPVAERPRVPEVPNPVYGSGDGSGPLGALRDLWHIVQDPYGMQDSYQTGAAQPPAGAGPAPALPPGYVSTNAPGSETAAPPKDTQSARPALPPGYYSTSGPPPPGYEFLPPGSPPIQRGPDAPLIPVP